MANIFKNKLTANVSVAENCYVCPNSTTATVIGCTVANTDVNNEAAVDVKVIDTSASITAHLVKAAPVPVSGSLIAIGGDQKVVLEAGDIINVTSTTSNSDVVISVLEIT